jgi:beta-lactamase regulating signal transducer with metallopeptidase domain
MYLLFCLLLKNETFFRISRSVLLFIVIASVIIPFIHLPQSSHTFVSLNIDQFSQGNLLIGNSDQTGEAVPATYSNLKNTKLSQPIIISTKTVLLIIYLIGVFISFILFVYSILSAFQMFGKSQNMTLNGIRVMIHNADIPAFSLRRRILISRHDYDNNADTILAHELSHIRQGHFYDLMLMEFIKIIYWFNPLVFRMSRDIKDIHEFQADEHTISAGIDPVQYQLLIIQKCVGHQSFALANSFNHCQIKKRITMMNKSKTRNAWGWRVAAFLPLLALLLMAFGKKSESVPEKSNLPGKIFTSSGIVQKQNEHFSRKIEIKNDGNYINEKLCSLQEIAKTGQEWYKASNDWILLLVDESVPLGRIDEVREALVNNYWVVQSTVNSDDLVYFSGDVTDMAKFTQGKWGDWMMNQLNNSPEIKSKIGQYKLSYSFIVDRNGKVRDAHLIKQCDFPEVNAAYEKILARIPDWEPAKRLGAKVSVYYRFSGSARYVSPVEKK